MGHYPDPDPNTGHGLSNWQIRICKAVAEDLGMRNDFTPAASGDAGGFTNTQGLYVSAVAQAETGGSWRAQVTVRCPFTWWGYPGATRPERMVVYRAIR